jgi:hypothetical protein
MEPEVFMRHTSLMRTSVSPYHRHRFPAEIISHCVWLYFRFPLSFRDVEEMLAMRGVSLSYETIREWCLKFGQSYANGLRRRAPRQRFLSAFGIFTSHFRVGRHLYRARAYRAVMKLRFAEWEVCISLKLV